VKTSDSLNHYLRGIEDEISGDVGQEVELVAHAPMLEQSPPQVQMHHHNYRGGGTCLACYLDGCFFVLYGGFVGVGEERQWLDFQYTA